jgi:hypothetical protein
MAWLVISFLVLLPASSYPRGPLTEDFSGPFGEEGIPQGWETLEFPKIKRHTTYRVERENDNNYLRAESNNSASGIYKEVAIDLAEYPVLSWRWKIEGIIGRRRLRGPYLRDLRVRPGNNPVCRKVEVQGGGSYLRKVARKCH